ncbi:MAG: hypothetical protein ACLS36_07430 [Streptococcus sp.]
MVVSSSETDEGLLEVHSQVDIVETSVSTTTPHSEEARAQAFGEDRSVAASERGDANPTSDSEQAKPNIVLTYDKSHEATATAESQAVTSMYKSERHYIHLNLLEIHMQLLKNQSILHWILIDICKCNSY